MTKFSNKLKKNALFVFGPYWAFFLNFGAKKIFFSENPALSRTTSYEFLAPCQISEKLMIQFQENAWTEGRAERWKDGRTNRPCFIGGPKTNLHLVSSIYLALSSPEI